MKLPAGPRASFTQRIQDTFRALRFRNFRLFFTGQSISLIGSWMQTIAVSWLVYRLTGSAFLLGMVSFASQIPTFLLSPVVGVLADRWNRRQVLLATQTLFLFQALTLTVLTAAGWITIGWMIALGVFLGCITTVDITVRQSFLSELVEAKQDLGNAIALNSMMFNGARLIGPSLAGFFITLAGEGTCFLINTVSFLPVIYSIWRIRVRPADPRPRRSQFWSELQEGFQYTFGYAPLRGVILLLGTLSLFGMSYMVLMPVFAKNILAGDSRTLGFLMAASGVGALVGTGYLAALKRSMGLGRGIPVAAAIFALSLMGFAWSRSLGLSLLLIAGVAFGFMVTMAVCNTVLQTLAADDKRGRVLGFYAMAFGGMAPLGSLMAGALATWWGAPWALTLGAALCLVAALAFALRLPKLQAAIRRTEPLTGVAVAGPQEELQRS